MEKENKSLSQQLCELCGIKPKRVKPLLCELKGYQHLSCEYCPLKSDECKAEAKVYPNFENPENFVKLYELDFNQENNLTGFIVVVLAAANCLESIPCNRQSYLKVLLLILQEEKLKQEHRDEIKQAIRNYDGWVWG